MLALVFNHYLLQLQSLNPVSQKHFLQLHGRLLSGFCFQTEFPSQISRATWSQPSLSGVERCCRSLRVATQCCLHGLCVTTREVTCHVRRTRHLIRHACNALPTGEKSGRRYYEFFMLAIHVMQYGIRMKALHLQSWYNKAWNIEMTRTISSGRLLFGDSRVGFRPLFE